MRRGGEAGRAEGVRMRGRGEGGEEGRDEIDGSIGGEIEGRESWEGMKREGGGDW